MILVTGGTGLVGAHLLYHLLQKHPKIRATHRASSDLESVKTVFAYYTEDIDSLYDRIEWVEANITEIPNLTKAFDGITQVYHCAAFISFNPKHYSALKKANIEGTANVVNLCLANKVRKLCYVSSIATLGTTPDGSAITEETAWNPEAKNSVYAITKYGAEMEVWRGTQEGLDAVVVKPGIILGEGYWKSGSGIIIHQAAKGIGFYTDGSSGFVDVRDVVGAMIALMESTIKNQGFILVSGNLRYQQFLSMLSKFFNRSGPKRKAPKALLYLLTYLDRFSNLIFGTKRKLLKATVRSMFTHWHYDASKIEASLPMTFIPIEETIKRVAQAYKNS